MTVYEAILGMLKEHGSVNSREAQAQLHITADVFNAYIRQIEAEGLVVRSGQKSGTRYIFKPKD